MVTILDRTGEQQEIKYDQRIYQFGTREKPKTTQVVPLEVATFIFRSDKFYVHTTTGEYVRRYGVVDAPEDWVADVGVDVLETTPLTRDVTRLEGWDAEAVDPLRGKARLLDLTTTAHRPRPGDYANQHADAGRG